MLGGVIGGYCATGRVTAATAPARVMTIDSTAAKIGRSMKKCENMAVTAGSPSALLRARRAGRLRRVLHLDLHFRLRPHPLHPANDHPLALLDPVLDHSHAVDGLPEFHGTVLHLVG